MQFEMIIPKQDNDGTDNAAVVDGAIKSMCASFGGATVFDAKGYWTNDQGVLFQDNVVVIRSAAKDEKLTSALRVLAKRVLQMTDQEAVYISINGKAEIIE